LFLLCDFRGVDFLSPGGLGMVVLRQKAPDLPRPYKMWGYPVTPLAFAAVAFLVRESTPL